MISRWCAALVLGGAAAVALAPGSAGAAERLTVTPGAAAAGGKVTVRGTCPTPVSGSYVRATVGVAALGRYVVVPVKNGAFRARVAMVPVTGAVAVAPGDSLKVAVTCATAASYVASAGTRKVEVVTATEAATLAAERRAAKQAQPVSAAARATSAAVGYTSGDRQVPSNVPLVAFAIAVIGTVAWIGVSRRSEQRAAAMAGHPAQRGLGREPRRARR